MPHKRLKGFPPMSKFTFPRLRIVAATGFLMLGLGNALVEAEGSKLDPTAIVAETSARALHAMLDRAGINTKDQIKVWFDDPGGPMTHTCYMLEQEDCFQQYSGTNKPGLGDRPGPWKHWWAALAKNLLPDSTGARAVYAVFGAEIREVVADEGKIAVPKLNGIAR
jgi:hypothetical protein